MDIIAEQIVESGANENKFLYKILIIGFTIAISILALIFLMPLGILIIVGIVFLSMHLIKGMDIEYEYLVVNGEIDVDKIISKKKRVHLLTVKVSSFESFGKVSTADDIDMETTTFIVSDGIYENEYYADFNHSEYGRSRIIFSPNKKVIESIKPYLSRRIVL